MKSDSLKRNRLGTQSQHSTHKRNSSTWNRSHRSSHSRSMIMKSTHLHLNRSSMTMRRIYYYQDSSCDQVDTKIPESFLTSHRPYITNHFYQQLFFYQPSTSLEESVRTHCKSTEAFQYTDIFSCLQLNQAIVSRGDSSTNYDQAGIKRGSTFNW